MNLYYVSDYSSDDCYFLLGVFTDRQKAIDAVHSWFERHPQDYLYEHYSSLDMDAEEILITEVAEGLDRDMCGEPRIIAHWIREWRWTDDEEDRNLHVVSYTEEVADVDK